MSRQDKTSKSDPRLKRPVIPHSLERPAPKIMFSGSLLPYLVRSRVKSPPQPVPSFSPVKPNWQNGSWKANLLPRGLVIQKERTSLRDRVEQELKIDFLNSVALDKTPKTETSVLQRSDLYIAKPSFRLRSKMPPSLGNSRIGFNFSETPRETKLTFEEQIKMETMTRKIGERCRVRLKKEWALSEGLSKLYTTKMNVMASETKSFLGPKISRKFKAVKKEIKVEIENKSVSKSKDEDDSNFAMPIKLSELQEKQKKQSMKKKLVNIMKSILTWHRRAKKMKMTLYDLINQNIIPKEPHERPMSRQFFVAVGLGDLGLVSAYLKKDEYLLYQKDALGRTPLHKAITREDLDMVRLLLTQSPDVEAPDEFGDTPLSIALKKENAAIVKELIMANADPIGGQLGDSPAHALVKRAAVAQKGLKTKNNRTS